MSRPTGLPRWLQAVGPVVVLAVVVALLALTAPFEALAGADGATTVEILLVVTVIGAVAGVVPVLIGMLWFPVIRDLEPRYLHGVMALAAGVLAFIALEMLEEIAAYGAESGRPLLAVVLAAAGIVGTFAVVYAAGEWRQREMASRKSGLRVAYLVAVALGLHSVGEGLGIGVAYAGGDATLVTVLVSAFVVHNVMEGPTVVAAVARDAAAPPLRHFVAMGLIAGGPVILGGWLGSFAGSPLLALLCYAVAVGAIGQVLVEVGDLIRFDAEAIATRTNAATFACGFALMFVLEDVLVAALLGGGAIGG